MKSAQRIVLAVVLLCFARPAVASITYHISLKNPEQHLFHVSMEIPVGTASDQEIIVALPAWNALYQVRDFSYRVRDVRARSCEVFVVDSSCAAARQTDVEDFIARLWSTRRDGGLQYRMGRCRAV